MSILSQYLGFNDYLPVPDRYMDYEKIIVDEDHRILIDRERGKDSIEPFIVLIPQKKDFFWHNYHCTDFCQGFKYDYEICPALYEYEKELKELISYLPELDKVMIEQGINKHLEKNKYENNPKRSYRDPAKERLSGRID